MSRFIIWNEQDSDIVRNGTKALVFNQSADAQSYINTSASLKEDKAQKPWTTTRIYDIITVT